MNMDSGFVKRIGDVIIQRVGPPVTNLPPSSSLDPDHQSGCPPIPDMTGLTPPDPRMLSMSHPGHIDLPDPRMNVMVDPRLNPDPSMGNSSRHGMLGEPLPEDIVRNSLMRTPPIVTGDTDEEIIPDFPDDLNEDNSPVDQENLMEPPPDDDLGENDDVLAGLKEGAGSGVALMESEDLLREIKPEPMEHDGTDDPTDDGNDGEVDEDETDGDKEEENSKRKQDSDTEEEKINKKKKSEEESELDKERKKNAINFRRNIREVMDENQLDEATLAAQRQEAERLRRVQDQQKNLRIFKMEMQIQKQLQMQRSKNRAISLLQSGTGPTSLLKASQMGSQPPCPSMSSKPSTVVVKVGSNGPPQVLNKKVLEAIRGRSSPSPPDNRAGLSRLINKPHMVTPSVSIAPVKPAAMKDSQEKKDDPNSPDIVTISSSDEEDEEKPASIPIAADNKVKVEPEEDDDDCIVISEPSDTEEEEDVDTNNSGMHTNDLFNCPDEQGRVLINVGKQEGEAEIFLAPQIGRVIKPHQIGGVRFLFDNIIESAERYKTSTGFGCILAHSMGLGKTLQVVSFCDVFLRETPGRTIMCIMPINTLQNWMAEFNMWLPVDPTASPLAAQGEVRPRNFQIFVLNDLHKTIASRAKVVAEWQRTGGVLLIGYEMYRQLSLRKPGRARKGKKRNPDEDVEDVKNKPHLENMHEALVKPGPDLVICDEGHRIKNSHASISNALKQIRTKRRVVLTGYPLQNNLLEYWCMVDFVRPNYLGTKTEFSNMFERPIQNGQCIDSTPQDIRLMRYRAHVLHSLLEGFVQRRSHSVLRNSLPQKEEYVLLVRMNNFQRQLYDTFMNEVVRTKAVPNPLKAFAVCCKIWNHPDILYHFLKKRELDELQDLELDEAANLNPNQPGDVNSPRKETRGRKGKNSKKTPAVPIKPAATVLPTTSQPEVKSEGQDTNLDAQMNYPGQPPPAGGEQFNVNQPQGDSNNFNQNFRGGSGYYQNYNNYQNFPQEGGSYNYGEYNNYNNFYQGNNQNYDGNFFQVKKEPEEFNDKKEEIKFSQPKALSGGQVMYNNEFPNQNEPKKEFQQYNEWNQYGQSSFSGYPPWSQEQEDQKPKINTQDMPNKFPQQQFPPQQGSGSEGLNETEPLMPNQTSTSFSGGQGFPNQSSLPPPAPNYQQPNYQVNSDSAEPTKNPGFSVDNQRGNSSNLSQPGFSQFKPSQNSQPNASNSNQNIKKTTNKPVDFQQNFTSQASQSTEQLDQLQYNTNFGNNPHSNTSGFIPQMEQASSSQTPQAYHNMYSENMDTSQNFSQNLGAQTEQPNASGFGNNPPNDVPQNQHFRPEYLPNSQLNVPTSQAPNYNNQMDGGFSMNDPSQCPSSSQQYPPAQGQVYNSSQTSQTPNFVEASSQNQSFPLPNTTNSQLMQDISNADFYKNFPIKTEPGQINNSQEYAQNYQGPKGNEVPQQNMFQEHQEYYPPQSQDLFRSHQGQPNQMFIKSETKDPQADFSNEFSVNNPPNQTEETNQYNSGVKNQLMATNTRTQDFQGYAPRVNTSQHNTQTDNFASQNPLMAGANRFPNPDLNNFSGFTDPNPNQLGNYPSAKSTEFSQMGKPEQKVFSDQANNRNQQDMMNLGNFQPMTSKPPQDMQQQQQQPQHINQNYPPVGDSSKNQDNFSTMYRPDVSQKSLPDVGLNVFNNESYGSKSNDQNMMSGSFPQHGITGSQKMPSDPADGGFNNAMGYGKTPPTKQQDMGGNNFQSGSIGHGSYQSGDQGAAAPNYGAPGSFSGARQNMNYGFPSKNQEDLSSLEMNPNYGQFPIKTTDNSGGNFSSPSGKSHQDQSSNTGNYGNVMNQQENYGNFMAKSGADNRNPYGSVDQFSGQNTENQGYGVMGNKMQQEPVQGASAFNQGNVQPQAPSHNYEYNQQESQKMNFSGQNMAMNQNYHGDLMSLPPTDPKMNNDMSQYNNQGGSLMGSTQMNPMQQGSSVKSTASQSVTTNQQNFMPGNQINASTTQENMADQLYLGRNMNTSTNSSGGKMNNSSVPSGQIMSNNEMNNPDNAMNPPGYQIPGNMMGGAGSSSGYQMNQGNGNQQLGSSGYPMNPPNYPIDGRSQMNVPNDQVNQQSGSNYNNPELHPSQVPQGQNQFYPQNSSNFSFDQMGGSFGPGDPKEKRGMSCQTEFDKDDKMHRNDVDDMKKGDDKKKDDKMGDNQVALPVGKPVKEEVGIPYDWATELLRGYQPGDIHASAKMSVFFCILEESINLGDRILVFSQSLFTLNLMEELLQRRDIPGRQEKWARNLNYFRLDGSTTAIEREKLINEFNSNPKLHLFLVSTRAGSLGINLVGANRVIVFDASWNPCHDTQAVCRVYRYGQKKPCFVYRLVTDNCLEKKIYDRQINKQGMSDRVVDECNPDAHLSIKEVTSLCWDDKADDTEVKDYTDIQDQYIDVVIQKVLQQFSKLLSKEPFQHESLLVDRKEKKLSQAEKRLAKRSYELEKQASTGSNRPLYQNNMVNNQGGTIRRGADKPMASVRPMQSEMGSQMVRGENRQRGWIPASVWQRQGMSAQEMTLPLDVVIPTNAPDRSSIVLKAGQKVMVLKSPKGIYMQLENGKIIAIRTSFKPGNQGNKEPGGGPKKSTSAGPEHNRRNAPAIPTNLRNNSAVSITPRGPVSSSSGTSPGRSFSQGNRPVRAVGPTHRPSPVSVSVTKKRPPTFDTSQITGMMPSMGHRLPGAGKSDESDGCDSASASPARPPPSPHHDSRDSMASSSSQYSSSYSSTSRSTPVLPSFARDVSITPYSSKEHRTPHVNMTNIPPTAYREPPMNYPGAPRTEVSITPFSRDSMSMGQDIGRDELRKEYDGGGAGPHTAPQEYRPEPRPFASVSLEPPHPYRHNPHVLGDGSGSQGMEPPVEPSRSDRSKRQFQSYPPYPPPPPALDKSPGSYNQYHNMDKNPAMMRPPPTHPLGSPAKHPSSHHMYHQRSPVVLHQQTEPESQTYRPDKPYHPPVRHEPEKQFHRPEPGKHHQHAQPYMPSQKPYMQSEKPFMQNDKQTTLSNDKPGPPIDKSYLPNDKPVARNEKPHVTIENASNKTEDKAFGPEMVHRADDKNSTSMFPVRPDAKPVNHPPPVPYPPPQGYQSPPTPSAPGAFYPNYPPPNGPNPFTAAAVSRSSFYPPPPTYYTPFPNYPQQQQPPPS